MYPGGIVVGREETPSIHLITHRRDADRSYLELYYMKSLDGGSTWKKANGDPMTLPATPETGDCVEDSTPCFGMDIKLNPQNEPYIIYSLDGTLEFAKWTETGWAKYKITTLGFLYNPAEMIVLGDSIIDVYLTKSSGGHGGNIERWRSTDRGENWSKAEDLQTGANTKKGLSPKVVLNNHDDIKVFWLWGKPTINVGQEVELKSYPIQVDIGTMSSPPLCRSKLQSLFKHISRIIWCCRVKIRKKTCPKFLYLK
jgi:hypothetical protein